LKPFCQPFAIQILSQRRAENGILQFDPEEFDVRNKVGIFWQSQSSNTMAGVSLVSLFGARKNPRTEHSKVGP